MIQDKQLENVRKAIAAAYLLKSSWRKTGAQFGISGALAYRIVNRDYEPMTPAIRYKLGLPVSARVVSVGAAIPNDTLALSASRCECGRWFIPNHPRRKLCFICSPYRRRK